MCFDTILHPGRTLYHPFWLASTVFCLGSDLSYLEIWLSSVELNTLYKKKKDKYSCSGGCLSDISVLESVFNHKISFNELFEMFALILVNCVKLYDKPF